MDGTDAQAVERAARGDRDAFMVLVRRYRGPLIGYIHGKTRVRDEAEDIAQDVLCKAWEHLPGLREPAAFGGWLFRIAAHAVVSAARRPTVGSLDGEPVAPGRVGPSDDCSVEVHAAVAALDDDRRIVVGLHHFSGLSTAEIAEALEIPPGTVRSRLSRAYGELRRRLADRVEV